MTVLSEERRDDATLRLLRWRVVDRRARSGSYYY